VGYPNVGKSTLISRISAARPKIADYPFTTLQPNLGVVSIGDPGSPEHFSFVVADIPGLIEGAHTGAGLGVQFLRHIERTRLLVHLVDVSDSSGRPDPVKDFEVIMEELASFGAALDEKPMIVVASKIDALQPAPAKKGKTVKSKSKLDKLAQFCRKKKLALFPISAVTDEGLDRLKYALGKRVQQLRQGDAKAVAGAESRQQNLSA